MESLIGETVDYAIEFDTETSDQNGNATGYPMPVLASGNFVVGDSQEISQFITYTYTGGGFSQTFSGTATIDLNASTLAVSFSGTAQPFDLKFTLSNLAQGSVQAVTGVTQSDSSGVQSGVNSETSPTFTNTSVTTGFNFLGYQPGTNISQTDQLTFGAGSPEISSATYDAASGQLVVTGSSFTTSASDFDPTGLSLTGEDDTSYTLSGGSVIVGTPTSTTFTVDLSPADQLAVDGLLNNNGTASTGDDVFAQNGATTYSLSGSTSFDTGARASSGGVTVSNAQTPVITSVSYDKATGVLTLNGSQFENSGEYGGINLGQITLKGGDGQTFTFNSADYGSAISMTQAVIDLSNTATSSTQSVMSGEEASVDALFDQDGSSSQEGTTYNFAAISGWDSGAGAAIDTQSVDVTCYCLGTLIATERGEVPVEALAIGDQVRTGSGVLRPIKWIGCRSYAGRFAGGNPNVLPIRFAAGSLAEGVPSRALSVSPKHAMLIDGVLIPAEHLVNGVTITQAESVERVDYFHVELDSHDVIVAEGALSETFVDDDSRGLFHNAPEFGTLYPDAEPRAAIYCAPRVEDGFQLEAVRRRLSSRAGLATSELTGLGRLRGYVEQVDEDRVTGWACSEGRPHTPVCLDVLVDGMLVARGFADGYRPDLLTAGFGDGRHAFDLRLPNPATAPERVTVQRSSDGVSLPLLDIVAHRAA